jgi:hypothetical protein
VGLFNRLKQGLGICTAKVELMEVPSQISSKTMDSSGGPVVSSTMQSPKNFELIAMADMEGVAIDPTDEQALTYISSWSG